MSSNSWKVCEVEYAAGFRIIPEGSERAVAIAIQRDPNAHGLDGISADEALHHARLIAAAPDFLEALERIARPHDCGCVPCTGQCRSQIALEIAVEEMQELARAAIAKATGEA